MSFSSSLYPSPIASPTGPGYWWFRQVMVNKKSGANLVPSIGFWSIARVIRRDDVHKGLYIEDAVADHPIPKAFNIDRHTKVIYEWIGPLPEPS